MKKTTKALLLKAKRQIFGELAGNNPSMRAGDGFDFYELRPYMAGEDVRRIDWKRSARMGEPYVRAFHEEREIQVILVPVMSGSLHFGTHRFKQEVVAELSALCGFGALKNGDRFSVVQWQDGEAAVTPLNRQYAKLEQAITQIAEQNVLGHSGTLAGLETVLLQRFKRRALVIVIGDFWEMPNFGALSQKHEVIALVVRDMFEEKPKPLGTLRVASPVSLTQQEVTLDTTAIKAHSAKVHAHDSRLFELFAKQGVRAMKLYTHEHCLSKLHTLFR